MGAASSLDVDQVRIQAGDVHIAGGWSYSDCGDASSTVQLKSIKISPDPPIPGEQLTMTVKAEVQETIQEGAYADVAVKVGLIKLLQKRFDICEEARNANATVQCPVEKGEHTVVQTVQLPREIPPAMFKIDVLAWTHEDEHMACAKFEVEFRKKQGW
ncbi:MD-2-related lipid-recognition [Schizophyllum commune Tattone D]|nr:MD-2-related lipid-recognition [Schizophyllum commune Tattone D]